MIAIVLLLTITNKTVVEEVEHIDLQTYNTLLQKKWYDKCLSSVKCKWLAQATYYEARGEHDEDEAALAYNKRAIEIHGENAILNVIEVVRLQD